MPDSAKNRTFHDSASPVGSDRPRRHGGFAEAGLKFFRQPADQTHGKAARRAPSRGRKSRLTLFEPVSEAFLKTAAEVADGPGAQPADGPVAGDSAELGARPADGTPELAPPATDAPHDARKHDNILPLLGLLAQSDEERSVSLDKGDKEKADKEKTDKEKAEKESQREIARLRHLLEEQRRAMLQAIETLAELETQLNQTRGQLSSAQVELERKKSQYAAAPPKEVRQNMASQSAEIATLRASLQQTEKQLARMRHIREAEQRKAAHRVDEMAVELASVQAKARQQAGFRGRSGWLTPLLAVLTGSVLIIGALTWYQRGAVRAGSGEVRAGSGEVRAGSGENPMGSAENPSSAEAATVARGVTGAVAAGSAVTTIATGSVRTSAAGANPGAAPGTGPVSAGHAAAGGIAGSGMTSIAALRRARTTPAGRTPLPVSSGRADFSGALDRLDYALQAFPGVKPETVLHAVYQSNRQCALLWNEGHPALIYGGGSSASKDSLASALSHCADAIENLR